MAQRQHPYARYGRDKHKPALRCNHCGEFAPIESNWGIVEGLTRMQAYPQPPVQPSCRTQSCSSFGLSVSSYPQLYRKHGETAAGTMRFQCKVCRKNVSAALQTRPKARAKSFERDLDVFRSLINKLPIRRICRRDGVDAASVYESIDYIHRKALASAAEHERRLPEMRFERLYLATDRQVYVVNWSSRKDRTNAALAPARLSGVPDAGTAASFRQTVGRDRCRREGGEIIDEFEEASIVRDCEVGLKPVSFEELLKVFERRQELAKERRQQAEAAARNLDLSGGRAARRQTIFFGSFSRAGPREATVPRPRRDHSAQRPSAEPARSSDLDDEIPF